MSEGILLAKVARGALLPEAERLARLDEALPQIRAVLEGETDAVAIEATLACLLWEALPQTNWCGFYRVVADRMLAVAVSVFGGSTEYLALWLKQAGHESWFYWYVAASVFCSLLVYVGMRDTRKHSRFTY